LIEALNQLEKEKDISKDVLLETLENSLVAACKAQYNKADNIRVLINRENGKVVVYAEKEVVEEVLDDVIEISLEDAKKFNNAYQIGDIANIEVTPKDFGRIAAQKAKQVILQKIREEERKSLYTQYQTKEKDIITGIVQRYVGKNLSVNLGKVDGTLAENEQVKSERYHPTERIKVYVVEVKDTTKGPKVFVSRTHPELVKRLFEFEVAEIKDGTVEIKSVAREAGSRTKISVYTKNKDVDPVGACVGVNGQRVNAIVNELKGEKIDIVVWDENPAKFIENALSPAKVVSVELHDTIKTAKVIVPDFQLSLAIGKEGQNARLAAKLTGYKIDIKSEAQEKEKNDIVDESAENEIEFDTSDELEFVSDPKLGFEDEATENVSELEFVEDIVNQSVNEVELFEDATENTKEDFVDNDQDSVKVLEILDVDKSNSKVKAKKVEDKDFVDFTANESSSPAKKKKALKNEEEKPSKKKNK
jgi:N utilization substance protein A